MTSGMCRPCEEGAFVKKDNKEVIIRCHDGEKTYCTAEVMLAKGVLTSIESAHKICSCFASGHNPSKIEGKTSEYFEKHNEIARKYLEEEEKRNLDMRQSALDRINSEEEMEE